jgi:DNA-binding response OmpR family regulator
MAMPTRLILAEDSETLGFVIHMKLQRGGYEVTWKRDGAAAWAAIQETLPDIVILDVMMPEMDGFEVLKRIKTTEGTWQIPVIMLTARAGQEDIAKGMQGGAVDYILKPFKPEDLLARVQRVRPPV